MTEERVPSAVVVERVTARYAGPQPRGPAPRPPLPPAALEAVSFAVEVGEVAVLLGANGAGKSTLLRLVAGLLAPAQGAVRIAGQDVSRMERRAIARQVAFVAQSEAPPEGFRVREVVAMGRAPHQDGWMRERDEDRAAVDDAIARCDLASIASRPVETLSGGEQRRVAVARALAANPRVLLLDEPAAFLDVRHRLELHDLLAGVASRAGIACVVSTHDLDAAARLADHVLLLRAGRVVAAGPPDDVMTPPRLRDAFEVDLDVGLHPASGRRYFVPLRVTRDARISEYDEP